MASVVWGRWIGCGRLAVMGRRRRGTRRRWGRLACGRWWRGTRRRWGWLFLGVIIAEAPVSVVLLCEGQGWEEGQKTKRREWDQKAFGKHDRLLGSERRLFRRVKGLDVQPMEWKGDSGLHDVVSMLFRIRAMKQKRKK